MKATKKEASKELRAKTLNTLQELLPALPTKPLTTEQLAEIFGVQPGTIRRGHSVDGHYMGLKPTKLPNRRLLWPIA